MSETSVAIVVAVLGSQALLEIVKAIIDKCKKPTAIEDAVKWMLQDRLERVMERDIKTGETTAKTRKSVYKGYKIYHDLKGNGDITAMLKDYNKVKVIY